MLPRLKGDLQEEPAGWGRQGRTGVGAGGAGRHSQASMGDSRQHTCARTQPCSTLPGIEMDRQASCSLQLVWVGRHHWDGAGDAQSRLMMELQGNAEGSMIAACLPSLPPPGTPQGGEAKYPSLLPACLIIVKSQDTCLATHSHEEEEAAAMATAQGCSSRDAGDLWVRSEGHQQGLRGWGTVGQE